MRKTVQKLVKSFLNSSTAFSVCITRAFSKRNLIVISKSGYFSWYSRRNRASGSEQISRSGIPIGGGENMVPRDRFLLVRAGI